MLLSGFTESILSELIDVPHDDYGITCVVINDFEGNVCRIEHDEGTDVFEFHIPTQKFGPYRIDETDIYCVGEDAAEKYIWVFSAWCRELFE